MISSVGRQTWEANTTFSKKDAEKIVLDYTVCFLNKKTAGGALKFDLFEELLVRGDEIFVAK